MDLFWFPHTIVMMLEIVTTEFHLVCTILFSAQGGDFQQTLFRHTCQVHSGHNTSKDVPHHENSRPNFKGLPITSSRIFLFTVTQSLQWCATNSIYVYTVVETDPAML